MNKDEAVMAAEQWDRAMARQRIETLEAEKLTLLADIDALRTALANAEAEKERYKRAYQRLSVYERPPSQRPWWVS